MNTEETLAMYAQHVMNTYARSLLLVKGRGAWVWDAEGHKYLDFAAGVAVNALGHGHRNLVHAIRAQAKRMIHVSNLYYTEGQARLAAMLNVRSLNGKTFFCNSGAEANEGLIKLARLWGSKNGGRWRVLTMRNSFHGRTLATLTATGQDKVQKGFEPLPDGFDYANYNDLDSVRAAITPQTAAILVEAMQGEGGVLPAGPEFMNGLKAICAEHNLLLMCDEVQTGIGRTGKWFGYQHYGVVPDGISVAKGLGGGFPIGAVVVGPKLADVFQPGNHGSTFGGTPLACAAACAVMETIEQDGLLERAAALGQLFQDGLRKIQNKYNFITDVRGRGLMVGLALDRPAKPMEEALRKHGLLAIATANTVIRFLPPLIITESDVRRALRIVKKACAEMPATAG